MSVELQSQPAPDRYAVNISSYNCSGGLRFTSHKRTIDVENSGAMVYHSLPESLRSSDTLSDGKWPVMSVYCPTDVVHLRICRCSGSKNKFESEISRCHPILPSPTTNCPTVRRMLLPEREFYKRRRPSHTIPLADGLGSPPRDRGLRCSVGILSEETHRLLTAG